MHSYDPMFMCSLSVWMDGKHGDIPGNSLYSFPKTSTKSLFWIRLRGRLTRFLFSNLKLTATWTLDYFRFSKFSYLLDNFHPLWLLFEVYPDTAHAICMLRELLLAVVFSHFNTHLVPILSSMGWWWGESQQRPSNVRPIHIQADRQLYQ